MSKESEIDICATCRFGVKNYVSVIGTIPWCRGKHWNCKPGRLAEADRDGRCVVLPAEGYTEKDGENALKAAMNTCFYHNNPVTRYIADAVAEKLTSEAAEAAMKASDRE